MPLSIINGEDCKKQKITLNKNKMGYYTNYEMEILSGGDLEIWDYQKRIKDISGYSMDESCTWYNHEEDMRQLSKQHKDVLFKLSGQGEDNEDMWVKYFKNGLMQSVKAKIVFDPFNESLLF